MSFFVSEDHLPVPFNLLPNPITLYRLIVWVVVYLRQKCQRKSEKDGESSGSKARFNCIRCCYFEEEDAEEEDQNEVIYQTLMSMLIQRYFSAKIEVRNQPPVTAFMVNITSQLKDMATEVKQLKLQLPRYSFMPEKEEEKEETDKRF